MLLTHNKIINKNNIVVKNEENDSEKSENGIEEE